MYVYIYRYITFYLQFKRRQFECICSPSVPKYAVFNNVRYIDKSPLFAERLLYLFMFTSILRLLDSSR